MNTTRMYRRLFFCAEAKIGDCGQYVRLGSFSAWRCRSRCARRCRSGGQVNAANARWWDGPAGLLRFWYPGAPGYIATPLVRRLGWFRAWRCRSLGAWRLRSRLKKYTDGSQVAGNGNFDGSERLLRFADSRNTAGKLADARIGPMNAPTDPDAAVIDVLVIGGGAAGLWFLDRACRCGYETLLLEPFQMGSGQTVASQGIIHGGLKYTLKGVLTGSADAIKQMPALWRKCLAGQSEPDLSATRMRSEFCYLWQTESIMSRAGMIGARAGLQVKPVTVGLEERPAILADCPGRVDRLDEQVLCPPSFISALAGPHQARLLEIESQLEVQIAQPGDVESVQIKDGVDRVATLRPRHVVLTAGAGNADLRVLIGLDAKVMQLRPLHMVMVRGPLPELNGHCVDGNKTRVTITSDRDSQGRTVWQIGGQISEEGVDMQPQQLIEHARRELKAVLPAFDATGTQWATYRVDRAEEATRGGHRPENIYAARQGNVITAWPTKLALVPVLADQIIQLLDPPATDIEFDPQRFSDWSRPQVAAGPWETTSTWYDQP